MTNRTIVSEIQTDLRAQNLDDKISQRYILNKLKDIAALYIKRENDQFRLYNQQDIWTTIDCLEFEEVPAIQCCGIRIPNCNTMMRSIDEIPSIYSFKGGLIIRELMSLDDYTVFIQTTPTSFRDINNREFKDPTTKYFWIENKRIIIPESMIKVATLTAFFRNVEETINLGCNKDKTSCIRPLDLEFQCPAHLVSTVKNDCLNSLLNGYKRMVVDEVEEDNNNNKNSNK